RILWVFTFGNLWQFRRFLQSLSPEQSSGPRQSLSPEQSLSPGNPADSFPPARIQSPWGETDLRCRKGRGGKDDSLLWSGAAPGGGASGAIDLAHVHRSGTFPGGRAGVKSEDEAAAIRGRAWTALTLAN